jgi:GGDEF domain-containing protein
VAVVHAGTRALFGAETALEIVEIVIGVVRELGGDVAPAHDDPYGAIPIDLGLGEIAPLLPVVPDLSVARLHIEMLLPALMEDARHAVVRLRTSERLNDEASTDPLTGVLTQRAALRQLATLTTADAVVLIHLDQPDHPDTESLVSFGALVQRSVRAGDVVGRHGDTSFLIGLRQTTPELTTQRIDELRRSWAETGSPVTFSAGVAPVGAAGPRGAVSAAARALDSATSDGGDRCEIAGIDED